MRRRLFGARRTDHPEVAGISPAPSPALKRWLRQGIELGICPLCRVAHKADREYIWHFSEEGLGSEEAICELVRAHGFCSNHVAMLEAIDRRVQSMLGLSTIFAELFGEICTELETLELSGSAVDGQCPACVNRDTEVARNVGYLLASLDAPAGTIVERYPASPGLCFPHFRLVWQAGGSPRARQLILDVQRRAVANLLGDLNEFIRKEGNEARREAKGAEHDAWQRALWLTAGWPASRQSAGVAEHDQGTAR